MTRKIRPQTPAMSVLLVLCTFVVTLVIVGAMVHSVASDIRPSLEVIEDLLDEAERLDAEEKQKEARSKCHDAYDMYAKLLNEHWIAAQWLGDSTLERVHDVCLFIMPSVTQMQYERLAELSESAESEPILIPRDARD